MDYNNDGYNDIYSETQGWNFINFYNPLTKTFSKQYQLLGDREVLLDSLNGLYINYREPYHKCDDYNSQLLDYKNCEPNIYYLLSGETYRGNDGCIIDSIKALKLYQYDQLKDSLILLRIFKSETPKLFDYKNFWIKNYKKLMGYK
ncbi:hypothetical protein ACI6Q2_21635 [Chitinophagaceae bacterium LWZ2-11]